MSDSDPSTAPTRSLFVPFVILAASVAAYLVWQVFNVQTQRSGFKATKSKLAEAIQQREPQVTQSIEIKTRLEALAIDLLELSKTDEKAMAIVKKYEIQRALPAAAQAAK
jgi:hypothetical protein